MAQKILITAANTALAYQLAWHLKTNDIMFYDTENHQNSIPSTASNSFEHQFLSYCLNQQIQIVFVLKADEQQALNQSKILFAEFGIDLMFLDNNQLKNIVESSFFDKRIGFLAPINDFESFSASVLKAGYPNKNVWFGKANGVGNIYQINDNMACADFLWTGSTTLTFTQASKLLNQKPFVPLNIYPTKNIIKCCHVLLYKQQIFTPNNLTKNQLTILQDIQKTFNPQGFLELAFADDKLIRLKNVQL